MPTAFKNKLVSQLGTTPVDILLTDSSAKTTVIGLSLTNMTEEPALISVSIDDGATTAYYLKDIIIPPNQSLRAINGGERLVLGTSTTVTIVSNTDNSIDVVMSYVEIS
jgi:hypothetical protein